jgi:hypothetical protein
MAKGRQRHTPASPQPTGPMQDAWRSFERGDKYLARRQARQVLAGQPSPEDAEQARDLLARTGVPRLAWVLAGIVVLVAALLILVAVTRV